MYWRTDAATVLSAAAVASLDGMRICISSAADSRNVSVSSTKAGYMPQVPATRPPRAAPRASITDQVAELSNCPLTN